MLKIRNSSDVSNRIQIEVQIEIAQLHWKMADSEKGKKERKDESNDGDKKKGKSRKKRQVFDAPMSNEKYTDDNGDEVNAFNEWEEDNSDRFLNICVCMCVSWLYPIKYKY